MQNDLTDSGVVSTVVVLLHFTILLKATYDFPSS
jgi:hypothetical protein